VTALILNFFSTLPRNILRAFSGRNLLLHVLAVSATFVLVISGFDWIYCNATRPFAGYLFYAVILGWRVPILFPVVWYILGHIRKEPRAIYSAYATAQAALIGLLISSFYKAFTGRPSPRHSIDTGIDMSRVFHLGFLKGGVFYGWPSSHTTIAFAMALAVWTMYPGSKMMRGIALIYAFYIGIGVSMTIHWFSDFVAGAIMGTAIGITAGNSFKELMLPRKG
jgi:membrane-associated phospholipid phosphatase